MVRAVNQKETKQAPESKGGSKKNSPTKESGTAAKAETQSQTKDPADKTGYQIKGENYVPTKTAAGGKSYHSGDQIAQMLEGKSLDEVYDLAARYTGIEKGKLQGQYAHLKNDGLRRMTLGNRIRGAINAKNKEAEKAEKKAEKKAEAQQ
jgi:hypothetical protein